FFFQAEDGIRDFHVTGVQTCALPISGQTSEHSLGRACDGTFGNSIGVAAQGPALDLGWKVTNWMKANAETLGVQYLIWQGKIWRSEERRVGKERISRSRRGARLPIVA